MRGEGSRAVSSMILNGKGRSRSSSLFRSQGDGKGERKKVLKGANASGKQDHPAYII